MDKQTMQHLLMLGGIILWMIAIWLGDTFNY